MTAHEREGDGEMVNRRTRGRLAKVNIIGAMALCVVVGIGGVLHGDTLVVLLTIAALMACTAIVHIVWEVFDDE